MYIIFFLDQRISIVPLQKGLQAWYENGMLLKTATTISKAIILLGHPKKHVVGQIFVADVLLMHEFLMFLLHNGQLV